MFVERRRPPSKRLALTLIELMVVLGIIGIGIVIGITLPAVQYARESARQMTCHNQLRNLGLAVQHHETTHEHYPTGGWGYAWVGDADRGFGVDQPGGWLFNILPYIEKRALREQGAENLRTNLMETPVGLFHCPSRRAAQPLPYTLEKYKLRNCGELKRAGKTDYAICAGDILIRTPAGPESTDTSAVRDYDWPPLHEATGISYVRSRIRSADVRDGTSHTVAVGEKCLPVNSYYSGESLGDDQGAFIGDDVDVRRWTMTSPWPDGETDDHENFGSPHRAAPFVMCDGSIRTVAFEIDNRVYRKMGNRADEHR